MCPNFRGELELVSLIAVLLNFRESHHGELVQHLEVNVLSVIISQFQFQLLATPITESISFSSSSFCVNKSKNHNS